MSLNVEMPSEQKLVAEANQVLATAQEFVIDSPEMHQIAGQELREIKGKMKALEDERVKITKPLDTAKKAVMDLFRKPAAILEQAETAIKKSILTYETEQRRIAAEAQARAEAAAKAERERLEREAAEKERLARAEAAKMIAAAEATGNAQAAAEAERMANETISKAQVEAVVLNATASVITAPTVAAEPQKLAGISTRETWSAEVTDKMELVKAVAANPQLLEMLEPNMAALNTMARALKQNMSIPGVKAVSKQSIAAGRG